MDAQTNGCWWQTLKGMGRCAMGMGLLVFRYDFPEAGVLETCSGTDGAGRLRTCKSTSGAAVWSAVVR